MILGFSAEFIPQIIAGTKVHTIRAGQRWKVGQPIHFCAAAHQEDAAAYKFWPDATVQAVQTIRVAVVSHSIVVEIDGRRLSGQELIAFAHRDGFASLGQLVSFLASYSGLPFAGQLIHWSELRY